MASDDRPYTIWAQADPLGVMPHVVPLLRRVPGVRAFETEVVGPVERRLLGTLAVRIEALVDGERPREPGDEVDPAAPPPQPAMSAGEALDALLRRSLHLTPADSREGIFMAIVQQLVPDEARILAALGDGAGYALVHVATGARPGAAGRRLLENASNVGRAAGVALPERVPEYLTHMRALGLADEGPEDPALDTEYEILLTEPRVRAAREQAGRLGRLPPRVIRATLRRTDLGRELWMACRADAADTK